VAWQPVENGLLAMGSRQSEDVWIYDSQLNPVTTLSMDEGFFSDTIHWSPDGNRLAVNGRHIGSSKMYVWEQTQPDSFLLQPVIDLTDRSSEDEFAWSYDSTQVAVIADLRAEVWDTTTGQLIQRLGTPMGSEGSGNATDIAWSPDGSRIAISTDGFHIHIIDANDYQILTSIVASAEFGVGPIVWSPDNTLLVAARLGTIMVFDANSYEQVLFIDNDELFINLMTWQGDYLAVAGSQPEIIIWDTTQWEMGQSITTSDLAVLSIAWKPNSTFLAYGGYSSSTITLVDALPNSDVWIDSFVEWLRETVRTFSR
jgi:WD40 repeat protein